MQGIALSRLDQFLGIAAETPFEHAILRQRFMALKTQLPWIYGIFAANLIGLHLAVIPQDFGGFNPTLLFLAALSQRGIHWLRVRHLEVPDHVVRREMRKAFFIALGFCATFCIWVITLYGVFADSRPMMVVMFTCLTAIGSCYGLSSYPAAARTPIFLLNLPVAAILLKAGDIVQVGAGVSLFLLLLLMLRMLAMQDGIFVGLVTSKFDIEEQRLRALAAERVAIDEQKRVGLIAHTDQLTGLANRRGFLQALNGLHAGMRSHAVAILDLDGFKPINDTFGHPAGDQLLTAVGGRLTEAMGDRGVVARLGGDEFALLYPCSSRSDAIRIVQQAVDQLSVPYEIGGRRMMISACAGVAVKRKADGPAEAMREADIALYTAKEQGRSQVEIYSVAMQRNIQRRTKIEQALRQPGLVDSIDLAFQPIFNLQTLELRGFEALARWKHTELGWISPAEFIPLTEQLSVIEGLSETLLARAASVALEWPSSVRLSFNLSAVQLCTYGSVARVLGILQQCGLPPERLQVEVTETALLTDFASARRALAQMRQAGMHIVLDDFGAGYSSISYLREMHFDAVKLDGSLVSSVTCEEASLRLLRGVLALCAAMGNQCIAEHIETTAQMDILRQLGCRYGQGFVFGEPVDAMTASRKAQSRVIKLEDYPALAKVS